MFKCLISSLVVLYSSLTKLDGSLLHRVSCQHSLDLLALVQTTLFLTFFQCITKHINFGLIGSILVTRPFHKEKGLVTIECFLGCAESAIFEEVDYCNFMM